MVDENKRRGIGRNRKYGDEMKRWGINGIMRNGYKNRQRMIGEIRMEMRTGGAEKER